MSVGDAMDRMERDRRSAQADVVEERRQPKEQVDHPAHYGGDVPHETWKCLRAWGLEDDALLWNAVKYISRAGKKDDIVVDLKKAQWYLTKRIEQLEAERASS